MIGIYKITNPSKKVYIGQSINIEKRFSQYNKMQCKSQRILYRSFLKYGVAKHNFEVICICEKSELNEKERYFQDLYSANDKNGLNCSLTNTTIQRYEHSDDTKKLMSEQRKGRILPPEWAEKVRLNLEKSRGRKSKQESIEKRLNTIRNNGGFRHTEESKLKMSNSQKGKKKNRIKKTSKETREKISKNNAKTKSRITLHLLTGVFFDCGKDAAICFGFNVGTFKSQMNGRIKTNSTNCVYI